MPAMISYNNNKKKYDMMNILTDIHMAQFLEL